MRFVIVIREPGSAAQWWPADVSSEPPPPITAATLFLHKPSANVSSGWIERPAVGVPCPSLRLGRWPTGDGPPAHPCWWAGWLAGRVVGRILLGRLRFDPPVGLRRSAATVVVVICNHRHRDVSPAEATATATRREESNALNWKALPVWGLYKQISQALRAFTGIFVHRLDERSVFETWAREPAARSLRLRDAAPDESVPYVQTRRVGNVCVCFDVSGVSRLRTWGGGGGGWQAIRPILMSGGGTRLQCCSNRWPRRGRPLGRT